MIQILFDVRQTQVQRNRGIGRYATMLITHLQKFPVEITLFASRGGEAFPLVNEFAVSNHVIFMQDIRCGELLSKHYDFLFIDDMIYTKEYRLTHCFDDLFPVPLLKAVDQIVTILYDCIHILAVKDETSEVYHKLAVQLESLGMAAHFFSISENTKNDFIKYLNISPSKITTVFGGPFLQKESSSEPYDFSKRENHIVAILGTFPRKNVERLIRGFGISLRNGNIPDDSKLYLCFYADDEYIKKVNDFCGDCGIEENRVILTGFVPDEELISLVANAKGTIFPSLYEGLGMPVLESYAIGTPCFASNTSSIKELVLPECSFDPLDSAAISYAVDQIFCNPALCRKSVDFGIMLIRTTMNWNAAAEKVYAGLVLLKKTFRKPVCDCAVFGVLPPKKSGIAVYNVRTFGINDKFHIFSDFAALREYRAAREWAGDLYKGNFFSLECYPCVSRMFSYSKKLFVLGNSSHNAAFLDAAVKEYDKEHSILYLHEINLSNLLFTYLGYTSYMELLSAMYPEYAARFESYGGISFAESRKHIPYAVRILFLITGVLNVIVNSDKAKSLLLDEIKGTVFENKITIKVLFHPFLYESKQQQHCLPSPLLFSGDSIKIGSFGFPDIENKSFDTIASAVVILNEQFGIKSRFIIAGYSADDFVQGSLSESCKKYITAFSDVSDDEMVSIMEKMDIAVQLRNFPHGESSGAVCLLLPMNKKIIVSENFIDSYFEKLCTVVPRFVTPDVLAQVLLDELEKKQTVDNSRYLADFSYAALSEAVLKLEYH